MGLDPFQEENPIFDRQPFIILKPVDIGIDSDGDLGTLNLTTQNLDQLTVVEVISKFVGLVFV